MFRCLELTGLVACHLCCRNLGGGNLSNSSGNLVNYRCKAWQTEVVLACWSWGPIRNEIAWTLCRRKRQQDSDVRLDTGT